MVPGSGGGGGGGSSRGAPLPKMFVVDTTRCGGMDAGSTVAALLAVPTAGTPVLTVSPCLPLECERASHDWFQPVLPVGKIRAVTLAWASVVLHRIQRCKSVCTPVHAPRAAAMMICWRKHDIRTGCASRSLGFALEELGEPRAAPLAALGLARAQGLSCRSSLLALPASLRNV